VKILVFSFAAVIVVLYLIDVYSFARRLRMDDEQAWIDLGRPDAFSARAQDSYLKLLLGYRKLPEGIAAAYSFQLARVRILLALGVAAMAWLYIVTLPA